MNRKECGGQSRADTNGSNGCRWRLQYEQNDEKGLQLYFTPLKGTTDSHNLPIGVRWNPQTKRYQSLDRAYEHFLLESPSIQDARSVLR